MATFTERQAIQQRMQQIREERRELATEYYDLLDRLRHLDEQDRDSVDVDAIVGTMADAVRTLKDLVPHIPYEAVMSHIAHMMGGYAIEEEANSKPALVEPHEIHRQRTRDAQEQVTSRNPNRMDRTYLKEIVVNILKDSGMPIKLSALHEMVEQQLEHTYSSKSLVAAMATWMLEDSRIEKPSRGYYQYRPYPS